ncbi:ATP-grasp domain-containing protein [Acidovorax sp. NCPPB 2350]|nr:ATP-grasp domain-containing protein [Acidovorax sp. NCPPB 2350]
MLSKGILLLSHCGFFFMEDLIAALTARGLRSYVLSSQPLPEHVPARLDGLRGRVAWLGSTRSHELAWDDVDHALAALRGAGEQVVACLTVWEGYREFMARANALLGVPDLADSRVRALRDKLTLRNRLYDAGFSRARARRLSPELLGALRQEEGARYFIKPVSGIASQGAFPLRRDTRWEAIERIRNETEGDIVYRSALHPARDFLVEDYLEGREFSFELIVAQGRVHAVGVHEKCEITEASCTVLEDCCTSPPMGIGTTAVAAGMAWVQRVFSHLGLDWGCFHVEARFDGRDWDLIEINPRVGGSLVSHSVKALNGGHGVLELWIDLLTSHAGGMQGPTRGAQAFMARLQRLSYAADGTPPGDAATFFRAFFAKPGTLSQVSLRAMEPAPVLAQLLLKPGDDIATAAREVFLAQVLWRLGRQERDERLPALIQQSRGAVEVHYARQGAPSPLSVERAAR